MLTEPTFWQSLSDVIRTIGIVGMLGALVWLVKFVWGAKGKFDDFVAGLTADRSLAAKTLSEVEAAKKVAMEEVAKAKAHGEDVANELRLEIEDNRKILTKIDENHLAHIQEGISTLNGKTDKMLEVMNNVDKNIGILVDRTPRLPALPV